MKNRLDHELVNRKLTSNRSQAENLIKLGEVIVDGKVVTKPGYFVREDSEVKVTAGERFVSRAGLKLASVARALKIEFLNKTVLDVGSSTGGFTDYALQNGATKVVAVELGTDQMDSSLRLNPKIELHEKTDIRDYAENISKNINDKFDIVVIDVSFISLREILPSVSKLSDHKTSIYAMVKPQFEAINLDLKHKGVIKNDKIRRNILKEFESWAQNKYIIVDKSDSQIHGAKGNVERFYHLKLSR